MLMTRTIALSVGCGARGCLPLRDRLAVTRSLAVCGLRHDTLVRGSGESRLSAQGAGDAATRLQNSARPSLSIADCGRRGRLIREKIIGHGLHGFAGCVAVYRRFLHYRVLALPHQPTREQSRCVLVQPRIQQLSDLLTQVGGVVQAREFVALQGITGSGEQELPGGLGFVIQDDLQEMWGNVTSVVTTVKSTELRKYCGNVCKSTARSWEQ